MDLIGVILSAALLIMLPLQIIKVRKYRKDIIDNGQRVIDSNNERIKEMEEHKKAVDEHKKVAEEHKKALEYFTETKNFNLWR